MESPSLPQVKAFKPGPGTLLFLARGISNEELNLCLHNGYTYSCSSPFLFVATRGVFAPVVKISCRFRMCYILA